MYETYITDIGQGLITALGAKGVKRYYDILHPASAEAKTAQEITDDIVARAGLKRRKKGGDAHGSNELDGNVGT